MNIFLTSLSADIHKNSNDVLPNKTCYLTTEGKFQLLR